MQGFWWTFNRSLQCNERRAPSESGCTYEGPLGPMLLVGGAGLLGLYARGHLFALACMYVVYSLYLALAAARLGTRVALSIDPLGLRPPCGPLEGLLGRLFAALLPLCVELTVVTIVAAAFRPDVVLDAHGFWLTALLLWLQVPWYGAWGAAVAAYGSRAGERQERMSARAALLAGAAAAYLPLAVLLSRELSRGAFSFFEVVDLWPLLLAFFESAMRGEPDFDGWWWRPVGVRLVLIAGLLAYAQRTLRAETS